MKKVSIVITVAMSILLSNCQKKEVLNDENSLQKQLFFSLPKDADIDIVSFVDEIKKQNETFNFLDYFLKNNGTPLWIKSEKMTTNEGVILLTPLSQTKQEISGFIVSRKSKSGKFNFLLFNKNKLRNYGFDETQSFSANKVQILLNHFNKTVFGTYTPFRFVNKNQIPAQIRQNHSKKIDINNLLGHTKKTNLSTINEQQMSESSTCLTYWEETEWKWDPDGEADPCDCSGNEYYAFSTYTPVTICWQNGNGWEETEDPTSGGGGSGWGDNWWYGNGPDPYYNLTQKLYSILQPGDEWHYENNLNGNDVLTFNTFTVFQNYLANQPNFEASNEFSQGNQKVVKARIDRSFIGGYDFFIKLEQDNVGFYNCIDVISSEWGVTIGWSFTQTNFTKSNSGNETTVDIQGIENYNVIIEGIGTVFKKVVSYRVVVYRSTGVIKSITKLY